MRRREFITLAGSAAAAWSLAARAQQPERTRRIGVLQYINESDPELQRRVAVFVQGLQKLGWREGANLVIDYRYGADDSEQMRRDAAELVRLKPDVIWTSGGFGVAVAKAGDPQHPDRLHHGLRSSRQRLRRKPGSARRQYHRIHAGRVLYGRKDAGGTQGSGAPGQSCSGHSES